MYRPPAIDTPVGPAPSVACASAPRARRRRHSSGSGGPPPPGSATARSPSVRRRGPPAGPDDHARTSLTGGFCCCPSESHSRKAALRRLREKSRPSRGIHPPADLERGWRARQRGNLGCQTNASALETCARSPAQRTFLQTLSEACLFLV